jgi:hypothetical protein
LFDAHFGVLAGVAICCRFVDVGFFIFRSHVGGRIPRGCRTMGTKNCR